MGGVILFSSKLGAQEASRKGTTLVFLHPQLSGPRGAPLSFRNRPLGEIIPAPARLSLPRTGSEGWDGVQTKAGFQLAG